LLAESYLDTGDRANFANGDGPVALYPDFASRVWDAAGCAPLVTSKAPRIDEPVDARRAGAKLARHRTRGTCCFW
jgi:hypothetical protein